MNNTALPQIDTSALTQKAMLVSLSIKMPSNSKQDKEASDAYAAEKSAKEGAARVNKSLYRKEVVETFRKPASEARRLLDELSMPWAQKGIKILLARNYFKVVEQIEAQEKAFWAAKQHFEQQFQQHVNEARQDLADLFNEDDYPNQEELDVKFEWVLRFMPLTDGNDWRVGLGAEEEEKIAERIQEQMQVSIMSAAMDPLKKVKDAVSALAERLEERSKQETDPDWDKRLTPIKFGLIDNLSNLADNLSGLNILDDPAWDDLASQMKKLVDGKSPDDFKGNVPLQESVAKGARELENVVDQYRGLL